MFIYKLTSSILLALIICQSVAWGQVCSCRNYYGVPHTCYYSPIYDYDGSCYSKCVREANQ